jgi:hypothetical protein
LGNLSTFRRARVRQSRVPREARHLMVVRHDGENDAEAPEAPQITYRLPVRAAIRVRPEWMTPLEGALVDLPDPEAEATHLEAAIDLLRRAAQATTVSERGDALLVAMEHTARSFSELFDRETARKLLRDVADGL